MNFVAKKPKPTDQNAPQPPPPAADKEKRKRNAIFVTLDEATEVRLQRFIDQQRVKPDRAAVAFTALLEFLEREENARKERPTS